MPLQHHPLVCSPVSMQQQQQHQQRIFPPCFTAVAQFSSLLLAAHNLSFLLCF
jgi:hypothetical protein